MTEPAEGATPESGPKRRTAAWRRRPVRRALIAVAVAVVAAAAALLWWPHRPVSTAAPTDLSVHVAARAAAGTALTVQVTGTVDGSAVTLTTVGSLGTSTLTATSTGHQASFLLPSTVTAAAGAVTVLAADGGVTAQAEVALAPGSVVAPIQAVVGPRSIVADGTDLAMVVAIPVDRLGNAVADNTPVAVQRRSPNGNVSDNPTVVAHLLAWRDLPSGTVAGSGQVWIDVGSATGPQVSLDEVAGAPQPFSVLRSDPQAAGALIADGQSLLALQTSVLRDKYGNLEPDGTTVVLSWDEPEGPATATGTTIGGVARLSVQAPDRPATFQIRGTSRGTSTATALAVPFSSGVAAVPVTAQRSGPNVVATVGPVIEPHGSFVPDGSVVTLGITDATGHAVQASGGLVSGTVTLTVPSAGLSGGLALTAAVLGGTGTAHLP